VTVTDTNRKTTYSGKVHYVSQERAERTLVNSGFHVGDRHLPLHLIRATQERTILVDPQYFLAAQMAQDVEGRTI